MQVLCVICFLYCSVVLWPGVVPFCLCLTLLKLCVESWKGSSSQALDLE